MSFPIYRATIYGGPAALPWNAAQDGLWLNTVKQFAA
jgi:hypothetical protein